MTSNEIRIDAQLLCGFQIENTSGFTWVKDAINYIARHFPLSAKYVEEEITTTQKDETYQIETELVRLDGIYIKKEHRPILSPEFVCSERGLITFREPDTYTIRYLTIPELPETETSPIDLPDRFAEPIKYYLAARIRGRQFGQGDPEAQQYDAMFLNYLADAEITMNRTNKRHRLMPARY